MINVVRKPEDTVVENNSEACQEAQSEKDPKDCGRRSAERKRQWNFPQQSRGVPRRGEPAVRQPSPSASERQSDATGVPSKQFRFIATNSWFI